MEGGYKKYGLFMLLIVLICCKTDFTTKQYNALEYKTWMNNYTQVWKENVEDIHFQLVHLPADYKFLLDFRSDFENQDPTIQAAYKAKRFFKLDISSEESTGDILNYKAISQEEISGRLEYILSDMNADFYIYNAQDTLYCLDVHYERNYGLNNKMSLMLTFANHRIFEDHAVRLVYRERLFNSGPITFHLDGDKLNNTPQLKIK